MSLVDHLTASENTATVLEDRWSYHWANCIRLDSLSIYKGVAPLMNLFSLMQKRTEESGPIRVGVIGAGKFASMFLTQALTTEGIHVVGVADIDVAKAKVALERTGWPVERYGALSLIHI